MINEKPVTPEVATPQLPNNSTDTSLMHHKAEVFDILQVQNNLQAEINRLENVKQEHLRAIDKLTKAKNV